MSPQRQSVPSSITNFEKHVGTSKQQHTVNHRKAKVEKDTMDMCVCVHTSLTLPPPVFFF